MKKNIFPFLPDANLIAGVDYLLKFIRQSIPLDEFFGEIPSTILNAKLEQLEFEYKDEKKLIIKGKDNSITLANNALSTLGVTITDPTQLVDPLIKYQKNPSNLSLKDALTNIITLNYDKNKQINIDSAIDILKNTALNDPGNKNKQLEIDLFFNFLKELIIQEISKPTILSANTILNEIVNFIANPWCISPDNISIFGEKACYSIKYKEIEDLLEKLAFFENTKFLAGKLIILNDQCLKQLFDTKKIEEGMKVIKNFQSQVSEVIKQNIKDPLSLEQLNIVYKILNAIAKLMPSFIISKNTRISFFQPYTPQNKILEKLEKTIQPKL